MCQAVTKLKKKIRKHRMHKFITLTMNYILKIGSKKSGPTNNTFLALYKFIFAALEV